MKIAVIGAGIVGVSSALHLSNVGYDVHLFEKENDILKKSSFKNTHRIKRGFGYGEFSKKEQIELFLKEYEESIIDDFDVYYCIPKKSEIDGEVLYSNMLKNQDLDFAEVKTPILCNSKYIIKAKEDFIEPYILKDICKNRLNESNIKLYLGIEFDLSYADEFDAIINCSYVGINHIIEEEHQEDYNFYLEENMIVRLPNYMRNKSFYLFQREYLEISPIGKTNEFIFRMNIPHASQRGKKYDYSLDNKLYKYTNKGIVHLEKKDSLFTTFIDTFRKYMPEIIDAKYCGSMVVAKIELEKPIIENVYANIINVLVPKIEQSVYAAHCVEKTLDEIRI